MESEKIPAIYFISTLLVNIDNSKLTDEDFRIFVRTSLSIVEKEPLESIVPSHQKAVKKYYQNH